MKSVDGRGLWETLKLKFLGNSLSMSRVFGGECVKQNIDEALGFYQKCWQGAKYGNLYVSEEQYEAI